MAADRSTGGVRALADRGGGRLVRVPRGDRAASRRVRYVEVEPWAWARLSQRLRAIRTRRSKLRRPSKPPSRAAPPLAGLCDSTAGTLRVGLCQGFSQSPATRARLCTMLDGEAARALITGDIVCHLPWFRRKKSEEQAPLARAPETPEVEPLTATRPPPRRRRRRTIRAPPASTKRRRGTRGGRNRKKTTAARRRRDREPRDCRGRAPAPRARRPRERKTRTRDATPAVAPPHRRRSARRCRRRSASCSSRSTRARSASPCSRTTRSPRSTSSGRSAARSPATSTSASSTTCCPAWRPRSSRSASRRTASSTSTRSSAPSSRAARARARSRT